MYDTTFAYHHHTSQNRVAKVSTRCICHQLPINELVEYRLEEKAAKKELDKKGSLRRKMIENCQKKKNELQNTEEKIEVTLLGHGNSLQDCISPSDPLHSLPPCCGGGLVQDRNRFRVPPPHVTLHCDHGFQSVHLSSTVKKSGLDVKGMIPC